MGHVHYTADHHGAVAPQQTRLASVSSRSGAGVQSLGFCMTQPRVSDLMRGKINLFGLDTLVNMAAAAGLRVEMHVLDAA